MYCIPRHDPQRNSSFLYKRNGNTRRTGSITLCAEPYNLTKKNSFKDSGLANERAIDLRAVEDKADPKKVALVLTTKVR